MIWFQTEFGRIPCQKTVQHTMTYVVIACHFVSATQLCDTTKARLAKVRDLYQQGDTILVTGDVPYKKDGKTLGQLMESYLVERGVPLEAITRLNGGVGTFFEAQLVCDNMIVDGVSEFSLISSPWYFFQAKPVWKRQIKQDAEPNEEPLKISFVSVKGTGGWRTWATYIAIGLVVRASILFRQANRLAHWMTEKQKGRIDGFTFNGCR